MSPERQWIEVCVTGRMAELCSPSRARWRPPGRVTGSRPHYLIPGRTLPAKPRQGQSTKKGVLGAGETWPPRLMPRQKEEPASGLGEEEFSSVLALRGGPFLKAIACQVLQNDPTAGSRESVPEEN